MVSIIISKIIDIGSNPILSVFIILDEITRYYAITKINSKYKIFIKKKKSSILKLKVVESSLKAYGVGASPWKRKGKKPFYKKFFKFKKVAWGPFVYYKKKFKKRKVYKYTTIRRRFGRVIRRKRREVTFKWIKRKVRKKKKFWWSFTYFVRRHLNIKFRKKTRKKLVIRYKDVNKKKQFLRKFLIRRYLLRNIKPLKTLVIKAQSLRGNKVLNFFFFLEMQLGIACLRVHFFWRLKKARKWVSRGVVFINGFPIIKNLYRVQINDLIKVALKRRVWYRFVRPWGLGKFHTKFYKIYNCVEINFRCLAAVFFFLPYKVENFKLLLRRRKKIWVRTKIFSCLVNSFY
jgi:ribosomal protein S4